MSHNDRRHCPSRINKVFRLYHAGLAFTVVLVLVTVFSGSAAALDINDTDSLDYWSDTTLDFRVETDGTITAYGNLNMQSSNNISNFFAADQCTGSEVVSEVYSNGSYACTDISTYDTDTDNQDLSEVLTQGNVANQTIEFSNGIEIGDSSTTVGGYPGAVAVGKGASASGTSASAFGSSADASGYTASAFGSSASASGSEASAVGRSASASADYASAFGSYASASASRASAFGYDADASASRASAFGPYTDASADYASAFGPVADASAEGAVAIGYYANAPNSYEATFGNLGNQYYGGPLDVNVTGDLTAHDELHFPDGIEIGDSSTTVGSNTNAVAVGNNADASSAGASAVGSYASASDYNALAVGYNADASSFGASAFGYLASASDYRASAFGRSASASGYQASAFGYDASTSAEGAVAIGHNANAPNQYEATFGNLNGEELDVNVTGDLTVHGSGGLDMKGNELKNVGGLNGDCPSGYVWVPGSAKFGTMPGFCVMKYEAKNSSGKPVSQASSTPWTGISQYDARKECRSLGTNYHLITGSEWMTVKENIMRQPSNWAKDTIGSEIKDGPDIAFADTSNNLKYIDSSGNVVDTGISDAKYVGGIADFDDDGDKDIAFGDTSNNLKYVDSSGNVVDTGSNTFNVGGIADFDGDGDLDIVFRDYDNGNLKHVDSSGNVVDTGSDPYNVGGVADFGGDGDKDIAFRDTNQNLKYVDSAGNVVDTGSNARYVGGVADFDGDGDLDIAFGDYNNDNLKYVDSSGNVVDTGSQTQSVGGIADVDDDGDLDIAFRNKADNGLKYVDSAGNVVDTGSDTNDVGGIADFDGDGGDSGGLYMGNVAPVGSHGHLGYNGSNSDFGTGRNMTARLRFSNGNYIWDISGNVWEWTQGYMTTDEVPEPDGNGWTDYTEITNFRGMNTQKPLNPAWNVSQGIGRLNLSQNPSGGTETDNIHAVKRGGDWDSGRSAGVLSVNLADAPSTSNSGVGFRCTKTPVT